MTQSDGEQSPKDERPGDAAAGDVDAPAPGVSSNGPSTEGAKENPEAPARGRRRREGLPRRRRGGPEAEERIDFGTKDDRPEGWWAIRFWRAVVILLSRLYHQLSVRTRNPLPASGAAILVSNHISALDPVLLSAASPRLIIWMMAREYYDLKSLNWFFKIVRAIPVTRGAHDTSATRLAIRALHAGRVLGVFPEGRIETSEELLPFHIGVAMMAIKTGVPVYPAYLEGTTRGKEMVQAVALPNVITLQFGPKIEFDRTDSSKEGLAKATEAIQAAVETLRQREMETRARLAKAAVS